jgi:glycosyltransferase involved in cell wall biosynthesis
MTLLVLSIASLAFAAVQCGLFFKNLPLFLVDWNDFNVGSINLANAAAPKVSVLIPARNEEQGIGESLRSILRSDGIELEIVVLDDHSTDATAEIVQRIVSEDDRVRYLASEHLPPGWNGKQHACMQLSKSASFDRMVFLDADVRLTPDGLRKMVLYHERSGAALLSVFPHQVTGTLLEKWLIPMMHYILLCFLPLARMRSSKHPAYAAGCGQIFMTRRDAYEKAGTHAVIRSSRHDGLKLPRAYRESGIMTDLIDGSDLAECRMYCSATQVVRGLLKNADEGIANAKLIVPFTLMLLGGCVLPLVLLLVCLIDPDHSSSLGIPLVLVIAITLSHLPRAVAAIRLRQSWSGVIFHSFAVVIFVALQWVALVNHMLGHQVAWRGRVENHRPSTT